MEHPALKPITIASWLFLSAIVLFVELPIYEYALATGVWMLCSIGLLGTGRPVVAAGKVG